MNFVAWWQLRTAAWTPTDPEEKARALITSRAAWASAEKAMLTRALAFLAGRKVCTPEKGYIDIEAALSDAIDGGYTKGVAETMKAVQMAMQIDRDRRGPGKRTKE